MSGNRILVVRGGAIGDFVLTLPVLAALRRQFPQAHLEVLGYAPVAGLAVAGGLTDAARSIEARALAGFFARRGSLAPELQDYFAGFAIILSYLYDPDGIFQENIARCSQAQFIAGPHRPDESLGRHAAEVLLRPLERLAIFNADPVPRLTLLRTQPSGPEWAVHPGSGSDRKNWPEPRWEELLARLVAGSDGMLLVVGGEAEQGRVERLCAPLPGARVEMANAWPLVELAGRLAGCAGFIGHDSGITHLAAALGLPALVLWGETSEEVWRPLGPRIRILHGGPGLDGIAVEQVLAEWETLRRTEPPETTRPR